MRSPARSVLEPVEFIAYTEDLHATVDKFSICHDSFADDTQVLENLTRGCLERCVIDIEEWVNNEGCHCTLKTELIWFGGHANLERLQAMDITVCLGQVDIDPVNCVGDLGVLLNCSLSMRQHITRVTSTCFSIFDGFTSSVAYLILSPKATCLCCDTDPVWTTATLCLPVCLTPL